MVGGFNECYWYLRNIQDLLSDGNTPNERWFGMPCNGTVIPFGEWSNITLFLRKTYLDCIILEAKVLAGISRLCIVRGVNLERRHCGRRHWTIGEDGRI